jgi:hypothetical protein
MVTCGVPLDAILLQSFFGPSSENRLPCIFATLLSRHLSCLCPTTFFAHLRKILSDACGQLILRHTQSSYNHLEFSWFTVRRANVTSRIGGRKP